MLQAGSIKDIQFNSPYGTETFLFLQALQPNLWSTKWIPEALFPGVKWLGCEDDHSPPATAEVKKKWSSFSTPPCMHRHFVCYVYKELEMEPIKPSVSEKDA